MSDFMKHWNTVNLSQLMLWPKPTPLQGWSIIVFSYMYTDVKKESVHLGFNKLFFRVSIITFE
jgi:hypothetical protein